MLHTKLVSCLKSSDLQGYRILLNLQHVYLRKNQPEKLGRTISTWDAESDTPKLQTFLKANGFEWLESEVGEQIYNGC